MRKVRAALDEYERKYGMLQTAAAAAAAVAAHQTAEVAPEKVQPNFPHGPEAESEYKARDGRHNITDHEKNKMFYTGLALGLFVVLAAHARREVNRLNPDRAVAPTEGETIAKHALLRILGFDPERNAKVRLRQVRERLKKIAQALSKNDIKSGDFQSQGEGLYLTSENGLEWRTEDGTRTTVSRPSSLRLSIPEEFNVQNYRESMVKLLNPDLPDSVREKIPEELISHMIGLAAQPTPVMQTWHGRTLMPEFPHDALRIKYFTEAFQSLIDEEAETLATKLKLNRDKVREDLASVELKVETWWQTLVRRGLPA